MSTFEMPEPTQETSAVEEAAPLPNESSPAAFFRVVRKLGREAALGRDSLPALVSTIAEAVANGALSPTDKFPDSDGNLKVSAAQYVFNVYAEGDAAKSVHERSKGSVKSQVSKIQQVIKASARAEPHNFRDALTRAYEMRKGIDTKKLKTAFDSYVDMARWIIHNETLIDDSVIEEANTKKDKVSDASVLGELKKAYQVLKRLLNNEAADKPRVYSSDARFDSLDTMQAELLDMIRQEEAGYDVPKPPKAEDTANGEEGDEQESTEKPEGEEGAESAETEATSEGAEVPAEAQPVTPEVQTSTQQAAE